MLIKALHPRVVDPKTYLTAKAASGQKNLVSQNAAEFAQNDFIVVGNPTEEQTEIHKIASISGNTLVTTANLAFTHPENSKITLIKYDQVQFYKASSKAGEYAALGSLKNIAIDEPYTLYDYAALVTDYFKIKYYNSQTQTYSEFSDAVGRGGFPKYALISLQDSLINKFGDKKEKFLDRDEITVWISELKDDMVNKVAESNEKHFSAYEVLTTDANGEADAPDDFKKEQKVKISYNSGSTKTRARKIELEDIEDNASYSQNDPLWYFNNYKIGSRPILTGALIYLWYEGHPEDMSEDGDELPKPIRFYSHVLMDGLMAKAKEKDGKMSEAKIYWDKYDKETEEMIEHINNLSLDENRNVKDLDEEMYGE